MNDKIHVSLKFDFFKSQKIIISIKSEPLSAARYKTL